MKKLLNFRPILYIALSLCSGLILGYSFAIHKLWLSIVTLVFFSVCCVLYLVASIINKSLKKSAIFIAIILFFFFVGLLSITLKIDSFEKSNLDAHTLTVSGRITYIEENDDESFKMILSDVKFSGYKEGETTYKIQVYCTGINDFKLGDLVVFTDKMYDYTVTYDQEFSANNISKGIKYFTSINSENIDVSGNRLTVFEKVNLFLKNSLREGLSNDEFALAYAMLLGNSDFMDFGILSQFRSAGIAHIFAVSGLHVGFIALVLKWIFDRIKVNRYLKLIIIGCIVFFYAGVCGFSASSVRASIMCVVLLFSESIFERYDPLTAVSVSALIILLYSPVELFCVGFQLSFVVVLGIVLLRGFFLRLLNKLPKKIADSLSTVISAQIAGIPICLAVFNKVSLISVVMNFLFLPIASTIFIVVFVSAIIGGLLFIPKILLFVPQCALWLINRLMSIVNYGFFDYGGISLGVFALFFYLFLLVLVGFFNISVKARKKISVMLASIFIIGTTTFNLNLYNSERIIVYGSQRLCFSLHNYQDKTTLILSEYVSDTNLSQLKRVMNKENLDTIDCLVVPKLNKNFDLQLFLTKLNEIDLPETIIYYDENNDTNHGVIEKSFGITNIYNLFNEITVCILDVTVSTEIYGYAVNVKSNSFDFTAVSNILSDVPIDATVDSGEDLLILTNRKEYIFEYSSAKNKLSYTKDANYNDAESFGYVKYVKK